MVISHYIIIVKCQVRQSVELKVHLVFCSLSRRLEYVCGGGQFGGYYSICTCTSTSALPSMIDREKGEVYRLLVLYYR